MTNDLLGEDVRDHLVGAKVVEHHCSIIHVLFDPVVLVDKMFGSFEIPMSLFHDSDTRLIILLLCLSFGAEV